MLPDYVERARALGVDAPTLYDGVRLPLDDDAVDTVFLLEVLEHLEDPAALLREARRVARRNVLVTTPNCTQSFGRVPVEFSHMLDVDHRQFFTVDVDAGAAGRGLRQRRWSSRSPRWTASSPGSSCRGRCGRSTAGSTTTGTSSRVLLPARGRARRLSARLRGRALISCRAMTRVLVVSAEPVGATMAGPAIRSLELARALAQHCDVTLAAPGPATSATRP